MAFVGCSEHSPKTGICLLFSRFHVWMFTIMANSSSLDFPLQVDDRLAWRTAIENESYNMQWASVEWCGSSITDVKEYCDSNGISDPALVTVKELSCALLQLSQGLETKYLKQPLGTF